MSTVLLVQNLKYMIGLQLNIYISKQNLYNNLIEKSKITLNCIFLIIFILSAHCLETTMLRFKRCCKPASEIDWSTSAEKTHGNSH